jgi:hypothetical protein
MKARKAALVQLGRVLTAMGEAAPWPGHGLGTTEQEYMALDALVRGAVRHNGWATADNVRHAMRAWGGALVPDAVDAWLASYADRPEADRSPRTVGLVLAGNVPLVGLHDVLCTWLSGHRAVVKCSSQEPDLIPALVHLLDGLLPGTADQIRFAQGPMGEVDAVIATGSDNTARYFEHYFGHLPRIVRKSRVSVAVLDGTETEAELTALGDDIFRYFGLGCRNVAKLYLPTGFDLDRVFGALLPWAHVAQHNKYGNNYDYTRAIWLLDRIPFLENGFVLMKEDTALASPMATVFYERYTDAADVQRTLEEHAQKIQCVVGHGHVPFGKAQSPGLNDYADGVDTLEFLLGL